MSLIRVLARPLLAAPVIVGGIDALTHPESTAEVSERAARGVTGRIPPLAALGPDAAVRLNGGVMVASGALLAIGRAPRLASLAIAASLVPQIVERAREYRANAKDGDPAARAEQRKDLVRSAGVLGGVLLAAVDTAGRPSLGRRAKFASGHLGTAAAASAGLARRELQHATHDAKRELHHVAREARLARKVATARLT
jgi:putative oxidoreductase